MPFPLLILQMQNPHNFFGIQPGSSHAGNLDPGTASRQTYMPFAPNAGVGDNPYAVNGSVVERSYPSNLAAGESSHVPVMNIMSGMLGPPRLPGVDHASMHNSWNSASLGNPRDSSSEMFRQFQIHRAQEGTPPVLPPPGQFSAGASGSAGAMPFGEVTPPSSSGVDVSMMLAQAMSVPLATAFLQSLLANAPASVPAPQTNAGIFPVAPSAPNPMVQMMMQMFQSSQQPASAVQIASPNLGTVQSPVPGSSGSASNLHAVQSPVAGASVLASVPSQAASSNGSPQAIQLPPLDANVAKTLLLQLAQQLQQAGQLPNDDTFQNFLRTIQSPGSTMTTSTDSASVVKTEIKKEPSDNLASRRKAPETTSKQLVKHVAKSEPAEEIMLKKESSKESDDIKLSKSSLSRVSSSGVYIDVAEGAVFTNMSEDTSSEDDAGNDTDGGRSCDEATDNELLSHVQLKSRNRSKSGNSSSVTHKSGGRSVSPIVGKKVAKGKGLSERDKGRPTEMYRSKSQTSHHSESSQDDNSGSRTTVQGYARKSVTPEVRHHKARSKDGLRGVQWNPNIRLKDCSIRLVRVRIVRDSNGRILIPKKESSRVTRLKQHKVHINVLSSYEDPDEPVIPKLERADSIDTGSSYYQSAPLEQKVRTNAEVPRPSVSRPVSTDASYRFTNEKLSSGQQPLQVAVSSNINSSKSPQLRSMYMGLIKDNMEWLSLVGCYRKPSGSSQQQQPKQYCQCAFCPAVGDVPLDVALHIRAEHSELTFALNKIRASTGSVLYICCRHCDFVAVEPTILWIHFEIHHNIPGILDSSGGRHPNINLSIDDPPLRRFSLDDTLASATSFVCFDCGAVVAEKDTTASSSRLARHVLRRHPDTQNYNGCFVKLLMLQHIETDAGLPRSAITYRDAIYEQAYERGRREVFVCMLCR
jgi:hypothetical protein